MIYSLLAWHSHFLNSAIVRSDYFGDHLGITPLKEINKVRLPFRHFQCWTGENCPPAAHLFVAFDCARPTSGKLHVIQQYCASCVNLTILQYVYCGHLTSQRLPTAAPREVKSSFHLWLHIRHMVFKLEVLWWGMSIQLLVHGHI